MSNFRELELSKYFEYLNTMMNKSSCNSFLWMPYVQSPDDKSFWHKKGDKDTIKPDWLQWEPGQPNGQGHQPCSGIALGTTTLSDLDCAMDKNCFVCNFEDINMFELRGLCPDILNKVDNKYLVDTAFLRENMDKDIIWTGWQKSRIWLDINSNLWTISSI